MAGGEGIPRYERNIGNATDVSFYRKTNQSAHLHLLCCIQGVQRIGEDIEYERHWVKRG